MENGGEGRELFLGAYPQGLSSSRVTGNCNPYDGYHRLCDADMRAASKMPHRGQGCSSTCRRWSCAQQRSGGLTEHPGARAVFEKLSRSRLSEAWRRFGPLLGCCA